MAALQSVAFISDIHGNLPALEEVLVEVDVLGVEALICAGDIVSGPLQSECIALLRGRGAIAIRGNCERELLRESREEDAWFRAQLSPDDRAFLEGLPGSVVVQVAGLGRIHVCHGSPRRDDEIITRRTPPEVFTEAVAGIDAEVVVIGHTHHQFVRHTGTLQLVNVGSVGLPYQGAAAAFWSVIGPGISMRRTDYDIASALERLRRSGMPGLDAWLHSSLVEPITADEAAAEFERHAGR